MTLGDIRRSTGKKGKEKGLEATLGKLCEMGGRLLAYGTNIPQLELHPDESKLLGDSIAECALTLPSKRVKAIDQLLGKIMPWVGLIGAVAVVGVPRWQLYRATMADRRFHPPAPGGANVRTRENGGAFGEAFPGDRNPTPASGPEETTTVVEGGAGVSITEPLSDDGRDVGFGL